jgi:hypothetical protein
MRGGAGLATVYPWPRPGGDMGRAIPLAPVSRDPGRGSGPLGADRRRRRGYPASRRSSRAVRRPSRRASRPAQSAVAPGGLRLVRLALSLRRQPGDPVSGLGSVLLGREEMVHAAHPPRSDPISMSLAHFLAVTFAGQRAWGSASSDTTQALSASILADRRS